MEFGLLILRLVAGGVFIAYGLDRLSSGRPRVVRAAVRPGQASVLVAVLELGGGLLLVLGLLTSLGAALASAAVLVALLLGPREADRRLGRIDELALLLLAVPFALTAIGPGAWSLDELLDSGWTGVLPALLQLGVAWVVAVAAAVVIGGEPEGIDRGSPAGAA
jgi:putative oxidoreductase